MKEKIRTNVVFPEVIDLSFVFSLVQLRILPKNLCWIRLSDSNINFLCSASLQFHYLY